MSPERGGMGDWTNHRQHLLDRGRGFKKKKKYFVKHPPVVGKKTNTEYTGSLGYNSVFRVCYITSIDVDVILGTCSTIEIILCYHK